MINLVKLAMIICGLLAFSILWSKGEEAEVVWVGVDSDEHVILYKHYANGEWIDTDVEVYRSNASIVTPFITTNKNGNKVLFWSEARSDYQTVLMMMTGKVETASQEKTITWLTPRQFSDFQLYNAGATAVIDFSGRLWVFWTSESDADSDIYYTTQQTSSWSTPQILHAENDVPDLQPMAMINQNGDIEVSWQSYSFAANRYIAAKHIITSNNGQEANRVRTSVDQNREISLAQIETPNFLPSHSQLIRIHYPGNQIQQYENLGR